MSNFGQEDHRHHDVNPLFIGLLGVIAGAIIVATLHFMLLGWCSSEERRQETLENERPWRNVRIGNTTRDQIASSSSRSNSSLQSIPTFKYTKECNEGVCAICLGEFKENDELRVLPECAHRFHVSCIDRWLGSHPNCPLCRADIVPCFPQQAAAVSSRDSLDILFQEHVEAVSSRNDADRVHIISSEHVVAVPSRDNSNEANIVPSEHVMTISTSDAAATSSSEISVGDH
ncbi:RING-type E3 ubiquitin transferase [Heracleum sosnowskyi]|uniref:RING-type E3 ubiquitin transferase n=1 Tax=Heracleum sosnowskyi TaxID=360622 RepID=A0AAD8IV89_9APIA|nr:RING-type E3 ubiquitin transferase [Heracleum sosnowskyi]